MKRAQNKHLQESQFMLLLPNNVLFLLVISEFDFLTMKVSICY